MDSSDGIYGYRYVIRRHHRIHRQDPCRGSEHQYYRQYDKYYKYYKFDKFYQFYKNYLRYKFYKNDQEHKVNQVD